MVTGCEGIKFCVPEIRLEIWNLKNRNANVFMFILFVTLHIVASIILIMVVLLQSGKAGDLASAFGGAGTQTAFGARAGTTLLSKATTVCAVIFMVTSLALSITYLTRSQGGSIMEGVKDQPATSAPAPANPASKSGGSPAQQAVPQQQVPGQPAEQGGQQPSGGQKPDQQK